MNRVLKGLVAAASLTVFGAGAAFGQAGTTAPAQPAGEKPAEKTTPPTTTTPATTKPAEGKTAEPGTPAGQGEGQKTDEAAKAEEKLVYVKLTTSKGDIVLELNNEKAPISVRNFLSYVDKGHYNGTIFHRVMPDFMIQGGGFGPDMTEKSTDSPIKNEWKNGLKNTRGAVAMARTRVADSATSQFFINVKDNPFLDQPNDGAGYAVFGRVVSGMETVDAIKAVKTGTRGVHGDVPVEPVVIQKAERVTAEAAKAAPAPAKK